MHVFPNLVFGTVLQRIGANSGAVLGPSRVSKTLEISIQFEGFRFSARDSISEVIGSRFEAVLGMKMIPRWTQKQTQK